jgi:hypothetical protein
MIILSLILVQIKPYINRDQIQKFFQFIVRRSASFIQIQKNTLTVPLHSDRAIRSNDINGKPDMIRSTPESSLGLAKHLLPRQRGMIRVQ